MFSFFRKKKNPVESFEQVWPKFKAWLTAHAPHMINELNHGATHHDIEYLEVLVGKKLPSDYKQFLKIHDGQDRDGALLIDNEEFLSVARVRDEWKVWKDLLDNGDFERISSEPAEGIKSDWWNPHWLPITYDGVGNHYCLDLDPADGGREGQVIRMWHDGPERELVAPSFSQWMISYVNDVINGVYIYSEDWGGIINKEDV